MAVQSKRSVFNTPYQCSHVTSIAYHDSSHLVKRFLILVKHLLASSRSSVSPSLRTTSARTGQITVKFDTLDLYVNLSTESQTG